MVGTGIEIAVTISSLNGAISYIRGKLKGDKKEIQNLQNAIKDLSKSIDSYFELYGYALDVYTTADDTIKMLLIEGTPVEFKPLYAEVTYSSLRGKFDNGLHFFPSRPGICVDNEDKNIIQEYISELDSLFGKGDAYLKGLQYNDMRHTIQEILAVSNKIRVLSRQRLLYLFEGLQNSGERNGC